jgi:hypothetical protein
MTDILGDELRQIINRACHDWDIAKIEDAIKHGEATVDQVRKHILRFEAEHPRGWDDVDRTKRLGNH